MQRPKGWQARERPSAEVAARGRGRRSPLTEAPGNGNAAAAPDRWIGGNSNSKHLRPSDIPYASSNTADTATAAAAPEKMLGGAEDKGITLRCGCLCSKH